MTNSEYEKIIKEGKRTDWYGEQVPEALITPKVNFWCGSILNEIHKLEGELSELKGVSLERRKEYLSVLWCNVKNAPYSLNGDIYLKKKKRLEAEMGEKEETQIKRRRTTRKKTTTNVDTTSNGEKTTNKTTTKNSGIIFGKNK